MNAIVLGSGRRIRNNFLPALHVLDVPVAALWSRNPSNAADAAQRWDVPVAEHFGQVPFDRADTVCLSVATAAVPSMLTRLQPHASRLRLVVDTPVFGRLADFRKTQLLRSFADVRVAEDYMNYPHFELMRRVAREGVIGKIESVTMDRNGYRYHGLATIRSFFGFPAVRAMRSRRSGEDAVSISFKLQRGRGKLHEPYEGQKGSITVAGSIGVLTDSTEEVRGTNVQRVEPIGGDVLTGFTLAGRTIEPPALPRLQRLGVDDDRVFNHLKTCGLIEILRSFDESNINAAYSYREALNDHALTALARKLPVYVDPLAWAGGSLPRLALR